MIRKHYSNLILNNSAIDINIFIFTNKNLFYSPYTASEFKIVMGIQVLTNSTDAIVRYVSKIIVHENYTNDLQNDIAILILKTSVTLGTGNVDTIALADTRAGTNTVCQVTGWGATFYVILNLF